MAYHTYRYYWNQSDKYSLRDSGLLCKHKPIGRPDLTITSYVISTEANNMNQAFVHKNEDDYICPLLACMNVYIRFLKTVKHNKM